MNQSPRPGNSGGTRPGGGGSPPRRDGRHVDQTRINDRIRAPKVRVIEHASGKQLGVMATGQAIRIAKEQGLDLVEVAANVDPPVCKIVDYGKYKYMEQKHKKETHRAHKTSKLKELKFRVGIDPHDYKIKIVHAEDFLADGHKVRVQLQFKGRQMAHQELGFEMMKKVKADLATMAHVDMEPKQAGRNINMQLSPLPERQRIRKFRIVGKEADHAHIPHASTVPQEHHDEHDDHHDAHHDDAHHDEHHTQAAIEAKAS